jgi:ankyrin repeat protein
VYLNKDSNPCKEDKDGWSPLQWAAFHGNEKMVKMLLKEFSAATPYLKEIEDINHNHAENEEEDDPFKKPKIASEEGKYTPIHWASYKGFHWIVWMLLKERISPLDIDIFGNTSVHQAAAGGCFKVIECFLTQGVEIDVKNARGHTPLDLATTAEVKGLLTNALKIKNCKYCNSKFTFKNLRFLCLSTWDFFCSKCSRTGWVYENWDSEEMEMPICRSILEDKKISKQEQNLQEAMETRDYHILNQVIKDCWKLQIEVKLMHQAEILHEKLERELDIWTYIQQ